MFFNNKYGDLDSSCISYGPCQSPTLAFTVARHDLIQTFKPEPFSSISAQFVKPNLKAYCHRGRIFDSAIASMFHGLIKDYKTGTVTTLTKKMKSKTRPQALNTVELLKTCSSGLGIGPGMAMIIAEKLYTRGFISYPRTETSQYAKSENLGATLNMLANGSGAISDLAKQAKAMQVSPRSGKDCGDHPPITPCRLACQSELSSEEWRVYEYVASHFMATVSRDMKYQHTEAVIQIGDHELFSLTNDRVVDPGFTVIMPWKSVGEEGEEEEEFSLSTFDLQQGMVLEVKDIRLEKNETKAPGYLTESDLITMMEKYSIGTDASIPVHVENIQKRGYAEIATGRKLIPTKLGIMLIHGYRKVDFELIAPKMRAEVEEQLELVATGRANFQNVLNHTLAIFQKKFHFFVENINQMDSLFETSFTTVASAGRPFTRCGKCSRYFKLIAQKPPRLYCGKCEETYSLPSRHAYDYKCHPNEATCPLDNFGLILCVAGGSRSLLICPYRAVL